MRESPRKDAVTPLTWGNEITSRREAGAQPRADRAVELAGRRPRLDPRRKIREGRPWLGRAAQSYASDEAESCPDQGPLRRHVVERRVRDNRRQSVTSGHGQERDDRLCGVAVAARRRGQAIADRRAAAVWLALEADPPDPGKQLGPSSTTERPPLRSPQAGERRGVCAVVRACSESGMVGAEKARVRYARVTSSTTGAISASTCSASQKT